MSIKLIEDRLKEFKPKNHLEEENALKEIVQEIALSSLSRAGFFRSAAFLGGTCLRIMYGMNRFSEDLDFSLLEPDPLFRWGPYIKNIKSDLEAYGFDFKIVDRDKSKIVKSVFLKEDSIGNFLKITYRNKSTTTIKIKLEVDTNPPAGATVEQKYTQFPVIVPVTCYDLPSLLAGKSHAILTRKFMKGRDWFDFSWYSTQRTTLNFDFLLNALIQSKTIKNKNTPVEKKWYLDVFKEKIKETAWSAQKKDVIRFLKTQDQDLLDYWSEKFFLSRLENLAKNL
jgi:predicted nucleotidyltransferase component of viral defense system